MELGKDEPRHHATGQRPALKRDVSGARLIYLALWASCGGGGSGGGGGGGGNPGTPAGSFNVTITGTSGSLVHPVNLSLTVQ